MAELSKLLGFMSAWDRRDTLQKYDGMFANAQDVEELIASLGTPTKLAITLAMNYVPSPAPEVLPVEAPAEAQPEALPQEENTESEASDGEYADEEEEEGEEEEAIPGRRVRFFGLLVSLIFGLFIGLPIALVLICVGLPFVVSGLALAAGVIWGALSAIPMLALFSDILVVLGAALVLVALGLLLVWFGLWVSFELGYLWISGVVLRLGRALTYKKEVAAQ